MARPARCAAKPAKPPRQRRAAGAAERRWQARAKPQELQHSPVALPSMRPPGPATAAASAPDGGGGGEAGGGEKTAWGRRGEPPRGGENRPRPRAGGAGGLLEDQHLLGRPG